MHHPGGTRKQTFVFLERVSAENERHEMFRLAKDQIPRAVVPVNRLHRAGEDQQELSGLAPSLWEKEPDVCLFGKRLCRERAP